MSQPFRHREPVRWKDIDAAGVLNNAVYLTLLEQARFAYFQRLGLLRGEQFPFLLGETTVRYLRPVRAGEVVEIEARVTRLGGKSFTMAYRMSRAGEPVAEAVATLVWADEQLRSAPIPAEARRQLAALEGIDPGG